MSIYKRWISLAYNADGTTKKSVWDKYAVLEQKIYEKMLETKDTEIKGTVKGLAEKHGMSVEFIVGFLEGINETLDNELNVEELTADSEINAKTDFTRLFKKMVEFKADHLHVLPQWNNIFSEEEQKDMYHAQKQSTTIRREAAKIGRNDPCPCNSGKKYKKCCG